MTEVADRWLAGTTYEQFMGRWSRELAREYVAWLNVADGLHWLDVGCGTGALADAICRYVSPASVVASDPAQPFIEYARQHLQDPRVSFVVAGVETLPARRDGYDCVASLLALNFFPDPELGLRNMRAAAAAGGVISACVWDYKAGMEFLRHFWDAAAELDPAARKLDEGVRFPLCDPDQLTQLFHAAGISDVLCDPLEIPTIFGSFEDYWRPMLGGTGPAPSYIASLDTERRTLLADKLAQTLPVRPDGTILLHARAWAIRGWKPM
jgi:SAM-dependent methyltransferase